MGGKQSKISKQDLRELLVETRFSEKQIKEWHRGFIENCPTGLLDRKLFISIYKALFPSGTADAFYEHIFRTFDHDGNMLIDFKEFLKGINITQSGKPEDKLKLAFRLYDIDRNGSIDASEMTEIIRAIYLMTQKEGYRNDSPTLHTQDICDDIFARMDTNKDGVLSQEEFVAGCMGDERLYGLLAYKYNR